MLKISHQWGNDLKVWEPLVGSPEWAAVCSLSLRCKQHSLQNFTEYMVFGVISIISIFY